MTQLLELETDRLRLRQWTLADRAPFAVLNSDPRVMEYLSEPLTRAASDALAERCQSLLQEKGWGLWAVEHKATGEFAGFVGLHTPPAALPFSPCVEIGWRLAANHWGRGLATEAAREALRAGFEVLGLPSIVSFTALGNVRSRAVMERLGMREAGTFGHPHVAEGSPLRMHCLYRLERDAYLHEASHHHAPTRARGGRGLPKS
jgi:RimJ/RimL family protein N-acetyltransferase